MGEKEILIKELSIEKENDCCHASVGSFFILVHIFSETTLDGLIYRNCNQKQNWPEEGTGK